MIIIGCPSVERKNDAVFLRAHIINEAERISDDLWYSVEPEFGDYLSDVSSDAFVIPMLLRAAISNQTIKVEGCMSEMLYHNVNNALNCVLRFMMSGRQSLKHYPNMVSCDSLSNDDFKGTGVGTGCSLGVDSFSVIKRYYLDKNNLPDYRLTHLCCFNVGAFGNDCTKETRESFHEEVRRIKEFGKTIGLPVVAVDSNMHRFYPERDFNWCHTYKNMGCAMALQKLFGKYFYASGYPLTEFQFNKKDTAYYDPFLLSCLSTESISLYSADMDMSRSQKVAYIADDAIVKDNLHVCIKEQIINDGIRGRQTISEKRNCGQCEKCKRTMLQLDFLGKLSSYDKTFNLSHWPKERNEYLARVIALRRNNPLYKDILESRPPNFRIPIWIYIYALVYRAAYYLIHWMRSFVG